ncbi:tripartite tricarboxylate transporter TctB family protein [Pararhizobium haloflavum]|uniref:tripartite tricarboxylate transporter TctB family protein n=1 Tax=Pararhizobium haloflavum TaxID=2037914 RepID=UPI0013000B77|nr:tripartite tricarboxylate transporter TctB family protein [Pararhizobium haloflavum]
MHTVLSKDFLAGVVSIGIGLFLIIHGIDYGIGTPQRMGSGFFPVGLGALLGFIGLALLWGARHTREPVEGFRLRALIIIPLAILSFGLLLPRVGFLPAGAFTVVLAGIADRRSSVPTLLIVAAVVVTSCWLLFSQGLSVRLPLVAWDL